MTAADPSRRASPPAARVVAILDFLAQHPHERFGLSELAGRAGLTKPTCLGILTTLAASGHLVRDSRDKTYRLGPALITLGHAAQESLRVSPAAREILQRLTSTTGSTSALAGVVEDRITVLELITPPGVKAPIPVGQRYPFAPPVGLMYVLWDDDALVDWLGREPTIPVQTDARRRERVVAECRSTGYLVERLTPGGRRLYELMAGVSGTLPNELRVLLSEMVSDIGDRVYLREEAELSDRQRHDINVISAPVYDHLRRQVMALSLHVGKALTTAEISTRAKSVVSAADAMTAQLDGVKPGF